MARTTSSQVTGTPCANWRSFPSRRPEYPPTRLQFPIFAARLWAPCQVVLDRCRGRRPLYTPVSVRVMAEGNRRISSAKAQAELGFHPRSRSQNRSGNTYRWFDEHGMLSKEA